MASLLSLSPVTLLFLVFWNFGAASTTAGKGPIVQTSKGKLRGQTVRMAWGEADTFFGVPYAQPPVGELRFEKTRPLQSWQRVRNATSIPPQCIPFVRPNNWATARDQYSEDCLYLNLFRPCPTANVNKLKSRLFPTLVIVHGGGFQRGSARRYGNVTELGQKYLSRGILVVVIQFRVGVYAHASTGSPQFAGNLGYWDMTKALHWLHANLAAFGGNPHRMTLLGYSSGSSSVGALSVSPISRHLFAQSIMMSGLVVIVRSASEQVVEETLKLAEAVGCQPGNATKQCLRSKSPDELLDGVAQIGSTRAALNYVKFGPRLDGEFLPADWPELIRSSKPKPTVIGINEAEPLASVLFGANESLHWDAVPWALFPTYGQANFEEYVRRVMIRPSEFGNQSDNLVGEVMAFYLQGGNGTAGPDFYLEKLVQLMSDLQFVVSFSWELQLRVRAASPSAPVFPYVFRYANDRSFPAQVHLHKAFHDNDNSYLMRNPTSSYRFDAQDEHIEQYLNDYIANFVHNGNPSTDAVEWQPALPQDPLSRQMFVQYPEPGMGQMERSAINFWNRMVTKYPQFNLILGRTDAELLR